MEKRGLSYRHGLPIFPHPYSTIPDRLREVANKTPNKEALVARSDSTKREVITFAELLDKSLRFAQQLVSMGLKKGDYVAMFVHNSIEWIIAEFGAIASGGIPVTLGSADDILHFVENYHSRMWGMVLDIRNEGATSLLMSNLVKMFQGASHLKDIAKHVIVIRDPKRTKDANEPFVNFMSCLSDETTKKSVITLPSIDPDDVCVIFTTSGSTGQPKLITRTHVSILTNADVICHQYGLVSSDVMFNDRPLGYIGGFPYFILGRGMTQVAIATSTSVLSNDPAFIFNLLIEEKATAGGLAPYLVYGLDKVKKLPMLKVGMIGGQRLSKQIIDKYLKFVQNPLMIYGSSESLLCVMVNAKALADQITDVLGYINPSSEVKIIDHLGAIVLEGTHGEICLRSVCVGQNYLMADGSIKALKDMNGWFHTGDVGLMNPDGLLLIKGRTKEIIKRSTMKIFPAEVEMQLRTFPGVEEVVVIGVPDERLLQEVCACIVPKSGINLDMKALVKHANDRFQPGATFDGCGIMPKYFMTMDTVAKSKTGKVDRAEMTKWAEKNLHKAHVYRFY